jgi:hypothetical protein
MPAVAAAWTRYAAGQYQAALDVCQHTIDMGPDYVSALRLRALARVQVGDAAGAAAELERIVQAARRPHPTLVAVLAHVCGAAGRTAAATSAMTALTAMAGATYVSPYYSALAHVGVGDVDAAFAALDRGYRDRDPNLAHVAIEPRFELLRTDARYERLLEALNLTRGARFA